MLLCWCVGKWLYLLLKESFDEVYCCLLFVGVICCVVGFVGVGVVGWLWL